MLYNLSFLTYESQGGLIAKDAKEAKELNRKGHKEGKGFYGCQYPGLIHWALNRILISK